MKMKKKSKGTGLDRDLRVGKARATEKVSAIALTLYRRHR